jgi:4'-phosphopantetheinyl transferase EntD
VAALPAQPLLLDLGPSVASAGFSTHDHEAVIAELAELVDGAPERAVAKRRAEFLAGRWAARAALSALGVDATPGRNEDGSPRWPEHTVGSITHGAERALCAVARSSDVRSLGIDAERLMSHTASAELRARICAADELTILREALGRPEHHGVTFAFSAKESLYKCLHPLVGRFMDFSAAHVVSVSARTQGELVVGELGLELRVDWSAEFSRGRVLRARFSASQAHVESAVLLLT